jgi:lipopolysaccharide export system permease protein
MLNFSQLTFYIDSLNKKFNEKRSNQFNEFNNTKIYYGKNYLLRFAYKDLKNDTLTKFKRIDTKAIFESLTISEKRDVLGTAIENVKEGNSYLAQKNESAHYEIKAIKKYEVEWNKKLTMSFACLVFFFIGAPLGAIIRKGGFGTPAIISIFFFVIYYVISISAQRLVEENVISTFAGMWAASYILLPIGVFLTYKATTDSVIMNIDTYLTFFRKIKDYFYRISMNGTRRKSASD